MNHRDMWHDSQQQQQRKKRPLPQLPHRSASGQFISVGPCWISTSHPLTRENSESTGYRKKINDSVKMETPLPTTVFHGIHQKPYEPIVTTSTSSTSTSSSSSSFIHHYEDSQDRSTCNSPYSSSPHTPEDTQYHDTSLLKRYSSPLYPLSHRHSMLLSPTSSLRDPPSTRRCLSTVDLAHSTIPSPWVESTPSMYTQTPNEIEEQEEEKGDAQQPSSGTVASFSLTHDKDALATYRRMATKTRDTPTQLSYMMYLIQVAGLYRHRGELRARLLQEAGYWLRRLARARVALALLMKGRWYLQHPSDPLVALEDLNLMMMPAQPTQPWRKAKRCFQQAIAASGSMEAHYELAMLLAERKPTKSMMSSFRMAADQYHPLACFKLATIFLFGHLNQAQDLDQGLHYLEKAAEVDGSPVCAQASFMLSCLYAGDHTLIGLDTTKLAVEGMKNKSQARHYLDRAVALHYPEALLRLGQFTENKWQAFQWYLQAECAGGMLAVARCYAQGIPGHLAPNPTLAFQWCQRAADHGLDQADYLLGTYYETGFGVKPDHSKALTCFEKATAKGYSPDAVSPPCKKQELMNCTIM